MGIKSIQARVLNQLVMECGTVVSVPSSNGALACPNKKNRNSFDVKVEIVKEDVDNVARLIDCEIVPKPRIVVVVVVVEMSFFFSSSESLMSLSELDEEENVVSWSCCFLKSSIF